MEKVINPSVESDESNLGLSKKSLSSHPGPAPGSYPKLVINT